MSRVLTAVLVTCAASLLESAPFILAGTLLAGGVLRRSGWVVPYLGCGCGAGPSARSLPAAAAAWLLFGPVVAAARLGAAIAVGRLVPQARACSHGNSEAPLVQLSRVLPFAFAGGCFALLSGTLLGERPSPPLAFAAAAAAAFAASPCGLGTVALAASMRAASPAAAAGVLCVAGILDARAWLAGARRMESQHDALGYALVAAASANVAAHHGGGLVHPKIAILLWVCAAACASYAYVHRSQRSARLRIAPAVMFAGSILAAPPPQYYATETTLAGAFAGERLDFTGVATRKDGATALVRYAITCCRADAAPIAVRIAGAPRGLSGWFHACGALIEQNGQLALRADRLRAVAAPADPFVYR